MNEDIVIPRHHYDDLINAANGLVTVTNNAVATILEGTPYESMLRGPSEALSAALVNVPGAFKWDGKWNEGDVEFTPFRPTAQPERSGPDQGIKATHRPTGLSVEAYSKPSRDANQATALRALKGLVEKRAREQGIT